MIISRITTIHGLTRQEGMTALSQMAYWDAHARYLYASALFPSGYGGKEDHTPLLTIDGDDAEEILDHEGMPFDTYPRVTARDLVIVDRDVGRTSDDDGFADHYGRSDPTAGANAQNRCFLGRFGHGSRDLAPRTHRGLLIASRIAMQAQLLPSGKQV